MNTFVPITPYTGYAPRPVRTEKRPLGRLRSTPKSVRVKRQQARERSPSADRTSEAEAGQPQRVDITDVFDLVVVGAGLGGLSFLWHLLESDAAPQRVLLIDKDFEERDDRTWCFWGPEDAPFADIATARWSEAEVRTRDGVHHSDLGDLYYHCVPSRAFRKRVLERIQRTPWITCLSADVADLGEDDWGAYVETSLGRFVGTWMVQSIHRRA